MPARATIAVPLLLAACNQRSESEAASENSEAMNAPTPAATSEPSAESLDSGAMAADNARGADTAPSVSDPGEPVASGNAPGKP